MRTRKLNEGRRTPRRMRSSQYTTNASELKDILKDENNLPNKPKAKSHSRKKLID